MPNYVSYSDGTLSDIEYEQNPQRELTPNLYTYDKTLSDYITPPSRMQTPVEDVEDYFEFFTYQGLVLAYKHISPEVRHIDIFFTSNVQPQIASQSKTDYSWTNIAQIITKMDISKYEVVVTNSFTKFKAGAVGSPGVAFEQTSIPYENMQDDDNIYNIGIKVRNTKNNKEITSFMPVLRFETETHYVYVPFSFFYGYDIHYDYRYNPHTFNSIPGITSLAYLPTPYNTTYNLALPYSSANLAYLIPSDGTIMQPLTVSRTNGFHTYSIFHKENVLNLLSLCGMRYKWQDDEYISIVDDSGQLVMGVLSYSNAEGKTELYGKTDLTSVTEYRPPVTPPPSSDESPFKPFTDFTILAGGLNYYYCKNNNVQSLINYLNDNDDGITVNDIISIRQISVKIPTSYYPSTTTTMTIAGVTTTIPAHKMITGIKGGGLGTITCSPIFNDYRDYEPYTHYELYLPYVGNVSLSPSECCGHVLEIYYALDMINGQGVYWISLDGTNRILGEYFFNFGVDIPLSAQDMSAIRSSMFNLLQSELSAMGSVMSGNPLAMIGAGANVLSNIHNVTTNHHVNTKGSSVSYLTLMTTMDKPRLKITHNQFKINPQYGHFVGYATDDYRRLGDLRGYTQCYNVDVNSIHCTDSERQLIKNLLEAGVYL